MRYIKNIHQGGHFYDEHKNFVETRCIGDPDEFDKKQAEAFYNEMLKWR